MDYDTKYRFIDILFITFLVSMIYIFVVAFSIQGYVGFDSGIGFLLTNEATIFFNVF